jgi:predicted membrane-bound dolichyl-phosphate-mannose-protein mannosyltransferase/membrane-associated phospholipid phosphatase
MSVVRLTVLSVYLTVLVWAVSTDGLPVDRPVVIAWLLGAAVIVLGGRQRGVAARAVADWLPIVLVLVGYDLSRGAADGLGMPLQVRMPTVADETVFGTVPTVWLQRHLGLLGTDVHWWEVGVSLVYVSHYIVPFALGVWLWARSRDRFVWWRDRFLTMTAIGLIGYVLLPTAPPWYAARVGELPTVRRTASRGWNELGIGIADRLFDLGRAALNPTAAFPSLHAAFAAFTVVAVWRGSRRWARPLLVAYPLAMGAALVVSGEHYVVDVVAGWAVVAVTIVLWRRLDRWVVPWRTARRERRAAREAVTASTPTAPPLEPPDRSLPQPVWVLAGGAALVALASRAVHLGAPDVLVFDEGFYAAQALEIAQHGVEVGHTVHPPGAKWAIAAGIRLLGFRPVGWRLVPLIAGAGVAAATVVAAFRAVRSRALAALAGLIVLTDGIAVTTGRLALLDGIVALWTTLAFAALVHVASRPLDAFLLRRRVWVVAVLFGCALASKWSAAPVWLASVGFVAWLTREAQLPRRRPLVVLVAVPLAVYALTYVPTMVAFDQSAVARVACADGVTCGDGVFDRVEAIAHDHVEVVRFHTSLDPTSRYAVSSWNWVVQTQPTVLWSEGHRRIEAKGNPLVWPLGTAALVWCGWAGFSRRRPVALLVALTALGWWAPWAIAQRAGFSFYAAPLVPVLAVGVAVAAGELPTAWRGRVAVAVAAIAVVGAVVLAPRWFAW